MGMGLIKWTYVNIRKYFCDKSEYMWLKRGPIFKMLVVIFESLYESSWHDEKDWVIVDILLKGTIGFDDFEVLIK